MRSEPRGIRSLAIRANRSARGRWTAAPPPLRPSYERGDLIPERSLKQRRMNKRWRYVRVYSASAHAEDAIGAC